MIYIKIATASAIIAISIPLAMLVAIVTEPWDYPAVIEVYYLSFCFFRNIAIILMLLKIKTGLLLTSIYSVFVAINLFFVIFYGEIKSMTDIWNDSRVISIWEGFLTTFSTAVVLYSVWIILTVINDSNFNTKDVNNEREKRREKC